MGLLAIELHDAGLHAASGGDGRQLLAVDGDLVSSPGVALLRSKTLVTGIEADRQSCLHPLELNDRFWDRLDTEPADPRNPHSPNRAEVACAHLEQVFAGLRQPDQDVVIAVPASYEPRQLGILAGIARELKLGLTGLVASPILVEPGPARVGAVVVVEPALHRCVLSIVEFGEAAVLGRTLACPEAGLHAFRRQWTRAIGDEFVRSTRFDPLHDATTEQQLHDRLAQVIEDLAGTAGVDLELRSGAATHRVTVTEQLLAQADQGLNYRLCTDIRTMATSCAADAIVLARHAALIPGLARAIEQQVGVAVRTLDAGAAARGLVAYWPDRFDQSAKEQGVTYHTRRTVDGPAD